jgi:hypothetical protein
VRGGGARTGSLEGVEAGTGGSSGFDDVFEREECGDQEN